MAEIEENLGDSAHANAANPYEMYVLGADEHPGREPKLYCSSDGGLENPWSDGWVWRSESGRLGEHRMGGMILVLQEANPGKKMWRDHHNFPAEKALH
ncbi:MAG TPA: hypothetical protein VND66_02090 [Acidobacteriaceae bacterium]|nr:hypothetical protein [Acidobacteriaceae bacterium]